MKTRKDFGRLAMVVKQNTPIFIGDDIAIVFKLKTNGEMKMLVIAPKHLRIRRGLP